MTTTKWRIHGDNIVECERALHLVAAAMKCSIKPLISAPYAPQFELEIGKKSSIEVTLVPGYGRWNIDIPAALRSYGSSLREAADAVITKVTNETEQILLAVEFCSALPAGNNAWQRNGRALAFAEAGVPYLFIAEVGGVELDANRRIKAPRLPNPLVPFSYVAASSALNSLCLPVYGPAPSSSVVTRELFKNAFGADEALVLIANILQGRPSAVEMSALVRRAVTMVELLSLNRKTRSTLSGSEWESLLQAATFEEKVEILRNAELPAVTRRPTKVAYSATLPLLLAGVNEVGCIAPGASHLPIAIVTSDRRSAFADALLSIYGARLEPIVGWLRSDERSFIVIWVTGFKPGGEDSRPDRGLVPMARMLFGEEADILAILWGPARKAVLDVLRSNPSGAASSNGLLESIVNLSDAVLVDSVSSKPFGLLNSRDRARRAGPVEFAASSLVPRFSEQDIDSVLHQVLSSDGRICFEGMCNPPGGDWSGMSLIGSQGQEFRWTSLPRVSGALSKRPDHVAQLLRLPALIVIESKTTSGTLEQSIGPRMRRYVEDLVSHPPTIERDSEGQWELRLESDPVIHEIDGPIIAVGAFTWSSEALLFSSLQRGALDITVGIEFIAGEERALLHVGSVGEGSAVVPEIIALVENCPRIEVQEH